MKKVLIILIVLIVIIAIAWYFFVFIPKKNSDCTNTIDLCLNKENGLSCSLGAWCDEFGRICGGASCVGMGFGECRDGKCVDIKKTKKEKAEIHNTKEYKNQYLKVTIPNGWDVKQATKIVYYGECINKEDCVNTPKVESNSAAVNITKGNYILYINTQAYQTGGAEGGRFSEIAMGAPSADAVIKIHPSSPCGSSETHPGFDDHPRVDLYINNQEKNSFCTTPSSESTAWYFSYITDSEGCYFSHYKEGESPSLVITMAYNLKDVDKLPLKDSAELNSMLNEMTDMIKTLEIRQQ